MLLRRTQPDRATQGHYPALDGLRGLAALWVLLFHWQVIVRNPGIVDDPLTWLARLGNTGVDLFFVLSAFLLTRAWLNHPAPPTLRRFWSRRAARILPAYWMQLLVLGALASVGAIDGVLSYAPDAMQWLAHAMLYLQAVPLVQPAMGPWWSLPVEAAFYLILPFFVVGLKRRPLVFVLGIIATALLLRWGLANGGLEPRQRLFWPDTFPARMHEFAIGMGCAWLHWRHHADPRFVGLPWRGIALICTGLLIALPVLGLLGDDRRWFWGGASAEPLLLAWHGYVALLASGIVLALAQRVGYGVFAHAIPVYLGRISFGLYLWHVPALLWTAQAFGGRAMAIESPYAFLAAGIALSITAAALSWHGLEEPILRRVKSTRVAE